MKSKLLFLSSTVALTVALTACNSEKGESVGGMFSRGSSGPSATENVAEETDSATDNMTEEVLRPTTVPTSTVNIPGEVKGKRYALVIGNADYTSGLGKLKNPLNDAKGMAEALKGVGFEVQLVKNASHKRQMKEAVDKFAQKLLGGGIGLFYYAGHGVAVNGENYLVPAKADLKFLEDAEYESLQVKYVQEAMEGSKSNMNIIILDACRNNPLPMKSRSLGSKGLAEIKQKMVGTIIMFATAPGDTAEDGDGKHGTYTQHLIDAIKKPGLTIEQMAKDVRRKVIENTGNRQVPWENASLVDEFCFVSCPHAMPASTSMPPAGPSSVVYTPASPKLDKTEEVRVPTSVVKTKEEKLALPVKTDVPPPSSAKKETPPPPVTLPAVIQSQTKQTTPTVTVVPTSTPSGPAPTTLQNPAKCLIEPWRCR